MKAKSKNLFIISLFIVYCLLVVAFDVQAAYRIEVALPGMSAAEAETGVGLRAYIRYIYLFGLSLIGVAALGALVYGGLMYMGSGTITSKEEAKAWIKGAVLGLVLGLSAYLILYTINPDLVSLRGPTLPTIEIPPLPSPPPSPPATPTCRPGDCPPSSCLIGCVDQDQVNCVCNDPVGGFVP